MAASMAPRLRPLLVLALAFLASGCSLFGIATKGEMRQAQDRWETRDRATGERLADIREDIEEVTQSLQAVQGDLGSRVDGLAANVERVESNETEMLRRLDVVMQRLSDARQQLANLEGALRGDMESIQTNVAEMNSSVATASSQAQEADARSRDLSRSYLERLQAEREILLRQLEQTEALLSAMSKAEGQEPAPLVQQGGEIIPSEQPPSLPD